jgi:hypothetical protein
VLGEHHRAPVHEVRGDAEERLALTLRAANEPKLPARHVAEPAVDVLRGAARRPAAEVAGVPERDTQPGPRGLVRDAAAHDSRADDEQVELVARELVEHA